MYFEVQHMTPLHPWCTLRVGDLKFKQSKYISDFPKDTTSRCSWIELSSEAESGTHIKTVWHRCLTSLVCLQPLRTKLWVHVCLLTIESKPFNVSRASEGVTAQPRLYIRARGRCCYWKKCEGQICILLKLWGTYFTTSVIPTHSYVQISFPHWVRLLLFHCEFCWYLCREVWCIWVEREKSVGRQTIDWQCNWIHCNYIFEKVIVLNTGLEGKKTHLQLLRWDYISFAEQQPLWL